MMTARDLIALCATDAQDAPATGACLLWLVWIPDGKRDILCAFRAAIAPLEPSTPPDRWADALIRAVASLPALGPACRHDALCAALGLAPATAIPPAPPSHAAVLLPTSSGPLFDAAGPAGEAAEAPWVRIPENAGAAARALPRARSLAAVILEVARRRAAFLAS